MIEETTAVSGSGASNASDFQPTTQNPQAVPVNLFQQQNGVQNVTNPQELLNEQRNVRISVASEPAATAPAVAQANESPVLFIAALLVVLVLIVILIFRKLRRRVVSTMEPAMTAVKTEVEPAINKFTQPKPVVKKKAAKKSKRRHR